jgi:hypothetical protein
MDHAANFRCGQAACCLLNYFQREREAQWSIALHTRFERFATDELHRIKAFAILLAIMDYSGKIRVLNLRSRACFAQKTRTRSWILCQLSPDHLERDN